MFNNDDGAKLKQDLETYLGQHAERVKERGQTVRTRLAELEREHHVLQGLSAKHKKLSE